MRYSYLIIFFVGFSLPSSSFFIRHAIRLFSTKEHKNFLHFSPFPLVLFSNYSLFHPNSQHIHKFFLPPVCLCSSTSVLKLSRPKLNQFVMLVVHYYYIFYLLQFNLQYLRRAFVNLINLRPHII